MDGTENGSYNLKSGRYLGKEKGELYRGSCRQKAGVLFNNFFLFKKVLFDTQCYSYYLT